MPLLTALIGLFGMVTSLPSSATRKSVFASRWERRLTKLQRCSRGGLSIQHSGANLIGWPVVWWLMPCWTNMPTTSR